MIAAVAAAVDIPTGQENETFQNMFRRIKAKEGSIVHQILFVEPNGALSLYRAPKTYSVVAWVEELEAPKRDEYLNKLRASVKEVEEKLKAIDAKGNNLNLLT